MSKIAVIHECKPGDKTDDRPADEQKWCLYTSDGSRLLGRHPSKSKAENQERAIQVNKHASLRSRTIRLAYERPELREHLLPLLKEASKSWSSIDDAVDALASLVGGTSSYITRDALVAVVKKAWSHQGAGRWTDADATTRSLVTHFAKSLLHDELKRRHRASASDLSSLVEKAIHKVDASSTKQSPHDRWAYVRAGMTSAQAANEIVKELKSAGCEIYNRGKPMGGSDKYTFLRHPEFPGKVVVVKAVQKQKFGETETRVYVDVESR